MPCIAHTRDAIGYSTQHDLAFFGQAAPHWQAFDCYVAAIMAETCPNRIYQHAVIVDASYYMCVK